MQERTDLRTTATCPSEISDQRPLALSADTSIRVQWPRPSAMPIVDGDIDLQSGMCEVGDACRLLLPEVRRADVPCDMRPACSWPTLLRCATCTSLEKKIVKVVMAIVNPLWGSPRSVAGSKDEIRAMRPPDGWSSLRFQAHVTLNKSAGSITKMARPPEGRSSPVVRTLQ